MRPNIYTPSGQPVSQGLAGGLTTFRSLAEFRALTPLPDNAQRMLDDVVVDVGLDRLAFVARLRARGLTKPLPNWLAVPELYWRRRARTGHAMRTMRPGTRMERAQPEEDGVTYPIYATQEGFSFHQRDILTAERSDVPLDTDLAAVATRNVNEAIEDAAINGGVVFNGNSSPGVLGAPNVNTVTYVDSEAWDAAGHSGADILTDVIAMANQLKSDNYFGPYELFIPTDYENKLNEDYSTNYPRTIRERLEELEFGGEPLVITVADQLPDDRTVMIQMTNDVVDVIDGQEPTLVQWQPDPWNFEFAVVGCQIVRVKDDYDGNSGICTGNV